MDRLKEAADLIVKVNKYKKGELKDYEIIKIVCDFFDLVKNENLTSADKQFLFNIANSVGIPHYFDTLNKFGQSTELDSMSLETISNCLRECLLFTDNNIKLHKFQKEILDRFDKNTTNRFFLSASTSFGKTFLVYEIIYKMEYQNVLLIFPSIALLSENLEKINSDNLYAVFKDRYHVNTISNGEIKSDKKNIFLFTPERYLSFLDFHDNFKFDFVFVDEVYKMDNEYLIDEEAKENERDVEYRLALFYSLMDMTKDALLAGPYIEFPNPNSFEYNPSFDRFLEDCKIKLLNYNAYEIVDKEDISIPNNHKIERYKKQIKDIIDNNECVIVYCPSKAKTESYASYLIEDNSFGDISNDKFKNFYEHLNVVFTHSNNWIVTKALKKGIGIHHGLIPKYIQKEIISLFNAGVIKVLNSTTTITEGVNTVAKNVLVLSHKKGDKVLKPFDALNIAGRAGRFMSHYKGNVYCLDKKFLDIKEQKDQPIKHKNYDLNSPKDDVDLFHTGEKYLNDNDKNKRDNINREIVISQIPKDILMKYKSISVQDKIALYQHIERLSTVEKNSINGLIQKFILTKNIDYNGFETIIPIVLPFVKNEKLRWLMTTKQTGKTNKLLTVMVWSFFRSGFKEMVNRNTKSIDQAVKETAEFVYNTLKYHVVKYFGVFNLMYKYYISKTKNTPIEEVVGIDGILMKMEYNAISEKGRIASDYGVPQKIIEYYEADEDPNKIIGLDNYEKEILDKVGKLLN